MSYPINPIYYGKMFKEPQLLPNTLKLNTSIVRIKSVSDEKVSNVKEIKMTKPLNLKINKTLSH